MFRLKSTISSIKKLDNVYILLNYELIFLIIKMEEIDRLNFVSVYEDEFKDFYDQYFFDYKIDKDGYLSINVEEVELPISPTNFIYWLLTTDHINGVIIYQK